MSRILVIGDTMLDIWAELGDLRVVGTELAGRQREVYRKLGGAANVAANVRSLGGQVDLFTVVGSDDYGILVQALLREHELTPPVIGGEQDQTHVRTRVFCENRVLVRVDQGETAEPLNAAEAICELLAAGGYSLVVFADYAHGCVTETTVQQVLAKCAALGIPVFADARPEHLHWYQRVALIKVNETELVAFAEQRDVHPAMMSTPDERFLRAMQYATVQLLPNILVVTRGVQGAVMWESASTRSTYAAATVQPVRNTVGAGDVFLAALAAQSQLGVSCHSAMLFATAAAGAAVQEPTTVVVTPDAVARVLYQEGGIESREMTPEAAIQFAQRMRAAGKKVVFTNGCFDLLHAGHSAVLEYARSQGDVLIVGCNSDASISRLKGEGRPVLTQRWRSAALCRFADAVVIFDEDSPQRLIEQIKPHVLVKGAEYEGQPIPGDDFVVRHGGEVCFAPMLPGFSTTGTLEAVRRA